MERPKLPEYTVISHVGNADTRDIDAYASKDDLVAVLNGGGFRGCHIEAIFHGSTDATEEFSEYID